jgi:hypothetical protein
MAQAIHANAAWYNHPIPEKLIEASGIGESVANVTSNIYNIWSFGKMVIGDDLTTTHRVGNGCCSCD